MDELILKSSSMSITGVKSDAVDAALVAALKLPNLHVVAAAGNSGADACGSSPASAGPLGAIVVGASSQDDTVPGFSNFGKCVTLWAPGTGIDSAGIGEPRGKAGKRMSGTSMAAPVVTGVSFTSGRDVRMLMRMPGPDRCPYPKLSKDVVQCRLEGTLDERSNDRCSSGHAGRIDQFACLCVLHGIIERCLGNTVINRIYHLCNSSPKLP